jgi:hypothetical protein
MHAIAETKMSQKNLFIIEILRKSNNSNQSGGRPTVKNRQTPETLLTPVSDGKNVPFTSIWRGSESLTRF